MKTIFYIYLCVFAFSLNLYANTLSIVENLASLKTINPLVSKYFEVIDGYSSADGLGGRFYWEQDSITEADGCLVIKSHNNKHGRFVRMFTGSVHIKWFGAKGNGKDDDSPAFKRFFKVLQKGYKGQISKGNYLIKKPINVILNGNINVLVDNQAVIIGGKYQKPIFTFKSLEPYKYSFSWIGGIFDNSATIFLRAKQSGTALALKNLDQIVISNSFFRTGLHHKNAQKTKHGDSGITIVGSRNIRLTGNSFQGQPDAGIYISGGLNKSFNNEKCIITNNTFKECNIGVTIKRKFSYVIVSNNIFEKNYVGLASFDTNTKNKYLPPGQYILVNSNIFKFIESRAIELRYGKGNLISNNLIVDWGYNNKGMLSRQLKPAIWLRGVSDSSVIGNIITFNEWIPSPSHKDIVAIDYNVKNVGLCKSKNNIIQDNIIFDIKKN